MAKAEKEHREHIEAIQKPRAGIQVSKEEEVMLLLAKRIDVLVEMVDGLKERIVSIEETLLGMRR